MKESKSFGRESYFIPCIFTSGLVINNPQNCVCLFRMQINTSAKKHLISILARQYEQTTYSLTTEQVRACLESKTWELWTYSRALVYFFRFWLTLEEVNCFHSFNGQNLIQSKCHLNCLFQITNSSFKNVKEGLLRAYIYETDCISSHRGISDDLIVTVKMLTKLSLYFRSKGNFAPRVLIDKDVICSCTALEIILMWIKRRYENS